MIKAKSLLIFVGICCLILCTIPVLQRGSNVSKCVPLSQTYPPNVQPQHASVSSQGAISGIGSNLTANQYAQSSNTSAQVALSNTSSNVKGFSDTPSQWTAYALSAGVSGLSDNISTVENPYITGGLGWWQYEYADNKNHCSGHYNPPPISGTDTGELYCAIAYSAPPNDYAKGWEYACFNQSYYIDRGQISGVHVQFQYRTSSSYDGFACMFINISGYCQYFGVFDQSVPYAWSTCAFNIPTVDIPQYFNTPGNVTVKVGVHERVTATITGGSPYYDLEIDNFTVYLRALAKPSQIQMIVNT